MTLSINAVKENKTMNSRWKTGSTLGMLEVPEGHRGRWCDADEANINKKQQEGWEFVNKTKFPQTQHIKKSTYKDVKDRGETGGSVQYRELVGMMLPIKDIHGTGQCVEERTKFFEEQTEIATRARIRATKNKETILGNNLAEQAQITSRLEIERTIIE